MRTLTECAITSAARAAPTIARSCFDQFWLTEKMADSCFQHLLRSRGIETLQRFWYNLVHKLTCSTRNNYNRNKLPPWQFACVAASCNARRSSWRHWNDLPNEAWSLHTVLDSVLYVQFQTKFREFIERSEWEYNRIDKMVARHRRFI